MDAFDSKDFYGHSLSEDPKLRTTTRNYEFKYNCSTHLDKVINRVKMDREKSKQDLLTREYIPDISKLCSPFSRQLHSKLFKKPSNIESSMSKTYTRDKVIRVMSHKEIETMISQVMQSKASCGFNAAGISEASSSYTATTSETEMQAPVVLKKSDVQYPQTKILPKIPLCFAEVQSALKPQWVEIKPRQTATAVSSIRNIPIEPSYCEESYIESTLTWDEDDLDRSETTTKIEEDEQDELKITNVPSFDSILTDDFVIRTALPQHKRSESPPGSPVSYGIESPLSKVEHAEMERIFGRILPHVPEMQFDNLDTQRESDMSPYTDRNTVGGAAQDYISSSDRSQAKPIIQVQHFERNPKPIEQQPDSVTPSSRETKATKESSGSPPPTFSVRRPILTSIDRKIKRQIELLKHEKIRIFSKMTTIQEKIIQILDKLRQSLLEVSLPDCHAERKVRERNAFEFSVRFSRNYLFPLQRMIEELRTSPKEDYRSAKTNEPCIKVCGLYGLLSEALQCYHKQLRHFFTDNIPKKLDVLLEMITNTTNLCLEKDIFDKRDKLIQCLLLRNSIFLDFVYKFTEDRKNTRDWDIYSKKEEKKQPRLAKTSSKWDLTMNLNNLNMYEPKLISKKSKKKSQKKIAHGVSSTASIKSMTIKSVASKTKEPIDTQVQNDNNDSLQSINSPSEGQSTRDLTKTVMEALQDITKNEVHQMLAPLVLNLDSILKNSDNPQTVESVLGLLNSQLLAKCNQLKDDAAATENSTQNSNTNQKGVTKKGTDRIKSVRRKERRVKREFKAKKTNQCNVNDGSTERTESNNTRIQCSSTMCDKESLSNIDTAGAATAVDKNNLVEEKTRSRDSVVHDGAFVSARKPKPAVPAASIQVEIKPRTLAVSSVQLDEVMLSPSLPPQPPTSPVTRMRSQHLEYTTSLPTMVASKDKFDPEFGRIGDGRRGHPKGYRNESATQKKVKNGAATPVVANEGGQGEACPSIQPPPPTSSPPSSSRVKNKPATSGQMAHLSYCSNALYTFVRYQEDYPVENLADNIEDVPEEECFADSCTRLTALGGIPQISVSSFKSLVESNHNLLPTVSQPTENEKINRHDVNSVLEERLKFLQQCKENPLYTNPQFDQPWEVLSKISQNISHEIVRNFESTLFFGEESYLRDFINMEMQT